MLKILNSKQFKNIFVSLVCVFGFLFLIFDFCNATILYLEPSIGEYHQGDVFLVEVRLDTQGEYINAVDVKLNYPQDILEVRDFSKGNSILSLWIEEPELTEDSPPLGLISFIGGVPGGYQGADGLLGRLIFKVREDLGRSNLLGRFDLLILDSRVLLNDGKGTEAKLTTRKGVFTILPERLEIPKDAWKKELEKDKISPQPFKIEISQNLLIFDGKYFITFSTTDKQTGIDHYEIKEGKGNWEKASSPYVLKNQKLMGTIWVKAIDKAGNYWIENLKFYQKSSWIFYGILSLLILVLIFVILKIAKPKIKQLPK